MQSLNRAELIGNVTRDPELKSLPSGQSVCSFSIATNQEWKDKEGNKQTRAEFHNIVTWGKLAEICASMLARGTRVFVAGRLQTRDWEGKDGTKHQRTEIVADEMIALSSLKAKETTIEQTTPKDSLDSYSDSMPF